MMCKYWFINIPTLMHKAWDTCGWWGGCVFLGEGDRHMGTPWTSLSVLLWPWNSSKKYSLLRNMWIIHNPSIFRLQQVQKLPDRAHPISASTAQNTEGYLRALPYRPKGTFFFACFYNCWKKTFSTLEVQGWSKETAVGQLPEKPYKSMAASRLLVPRAAPASCGCQGSQM